MGEISKQKHDEEVVERSEVAPAAGAPDTDTTIVRVPLTFFDLHWAGPARVKRIFFYDFPHSTSHFMETTLPKLKNSLCLTLQYFFPLAGNLCCPPQPQKPFIRFIPNVDSVPLTIIQHSPSSSSDFKHLVSNSNHSRDIQELEHLVAELPLFPKPCHDEVVFPMLSVKITLFPGEGLCIGTTYRHVVDGRSFNHFITSWASLCLNNNTAISSLPFFDREVVQDPNGTLEAVLLQSYFNNLAFWKHIMNLKGSPFSLGGGGDEQIVRITLELGAPDLERLKNWVSLRFKPAAPTTISRLTATCALLWTSLVRSTRGSLEENGEQEEWIVLHADCRNRLGNIPSTYFGSCLTPVGAVLKHKHFLEQKESVVAAVKVIDAAISRMKRDPLHDTEEMMGKVTELAVSGRGVRLTTVAGSPSFGVYNKMDFGFGKPSKVDLVNMVNNFFFAESAKEEGGFEVGLSLKKDHVDHFLSVFEQGLKTIRQLD